MLICAYLVQFQLLGSMFSTENVGLLFTSFRYLIHAPFFSEKKEEHQAKWKQMEELKAAGLTRSIGVSNYLPEHLDWLLETATTPPSINQIEFHPYLQHAGLIDYHKKHGIALSAYGPHTPVTKAPGGPVDDVLAKLSKKYAVNPGEILLRWCIDQDIVAITTSSKEQRLSDYLRAMTFKLNPAEIKMVSLFLLLWPESACFEMYSADFSL
jgi:diketogulonate reductase-like aldo/keto reductase